MMGMFFRARRAGFGVPMTSSISLRLFLGLAFAATACSGFSTGNIVVPPSNSSGSTQIMHTNYLIWTGPWHRVSMDVGDPERHVAAQPRASVPGYHPVDIHNAYQIPFGLGTGAIAIVDAYHYPNSLPDFNTFSQNFGLPVEPSANPLANSNSVYQVVYAGGSQPTSDAGWAGEESLDIQWAHAMAPNAKIYLVEANTNSLTDLLNAVQVAEGLPGVREISMSWGSGEFQGEQQAEDPFFQSPGITYFASTGDSPAARLYPALSAFVVAVGGTTLHVSQAGTVTSETAWAAGGGGPSAFVTRPAYQSGVASIVGTKRGAPDISAVADPATGVAVFNQFAAGGWFVVGGTSVAAPVCAGIANARGAFSDSGTSELNRIYLNLGQPIFRDITGGNNGFPALPGYDLATGCGVPVGPYPIGTGGTPVSPIGVDAYIGSFVSGDVDSLTSVDGNTFSVSSGQFVGLGAVAGTEVMYQVPLNGHSLQGLGLQLDMQGVSGATAQVFLWNWQTARYELKTSIALRSTTSSKTVTLTGFGPYVDAAGNVKVLVRAVNPARNVGPGGGAPFTFSIDDAQILYILGS